MNTHLFLTDSTVWLERLLPSGSLSAQVWRALQESGPFWLAGGAVRDALLGRQSYDLDFTVPADAIPRARRLANRFGGAFYILDAQRDAGRVLLERGGDVPLVVDVARLRAETIEADLAERDFTINAIAIGGHPPYPILDPCGGLDALAQRRIAIVSDGAFRQDGVRLLRAVRFAAQLGFTLSPETEAAIRRDAPLIAGAAMERVRDELVRLLHQPGVARHFRRMETLGLLPHVLPELANCRGVPQSPPHYLDVFDHTLEVVRHSEALLSALGLRMADVDDAPPSRLVTLPTVLERWRGELAAALSASTSDSRTVADLLLWAALAHDWGKSHTQTVDEEGRFRFFEHDQVGRELAQHRFTALRFSANEVQALTTIVRQHMRPSYLAYEAAKPSGSLVGNGSAVAMPTRRAIYRFFRATEAMTVPTLLLYLCDYLGVRGPQTVDEEWQAHVSFVARLLAAWFSEPTLARPKPLVSGDELMAALRLSPGRTVGHLLAKLQEAQAVGEIRTRAEALAWARAWLERGGG